MNPGGIWTFVVTLVGLAIIVGLIFAAMEFRPLPEPYRKFARLAVGGAAALGVLFAIGAVLGMAGAGAVHVTIEGIIEFAVGVICLYLFLYVVDLALDYSAVPFAANIKFILSVLALVIILVLAYAALTTGGLGLMGLGGIPRLGR